MKLFLVFLGLIVSLSFYAYWGVYQPKQAEEALLSAKQIIPSDEGVTQVRITHGTEEFSLELIDGFWWVTEPHRYPADQVFIIKGLQIMHETLAKDVFPFKEDRFGLTPGKALIDLSFNNGLKKRLIVGSETGAASSIYVLDQDSKTVAVVHNVWSQFLYYPLQRFYSQTLPIPGQQVKAIRLLQGDSVQWALSSKDKKTMQISYGGRSYETPKAQWLWFFKKIREFSLNNLEFSQAKKIKTDEVLEVETEQGNIRFHFSKKADEVWVEQMKVYGQADPFSLKSLGIEINKVINRDKK